MPRTKKDLVRQVEDAARPFLERGETLMRAAEALRGPKPLLASLLSPLGFFLLERPRFVVLTNRRLLLVIPPPRARAAARLDTALPRDSIEVESYEATGIWARLILRAGSARHPLNFARVWRTEADLLHRKLAGAR